MSSIEEIIQTYESVVKVVDTDAKNTSRAYGGYIRATKGKLQEYITEEVVKIAWRNIGGNGERLEINSKKIPIPIKLEYVKNIKSKEVREYIFENIEQYIYGLSVDKHIFIDNIFVVGIECKAYTESAMLKRILVDFHLLKTQFSNISCFLFQLESQLGGDYSQLFEITFGAHSSHSIMSYFEDVDLNIFTFLKGERDINSPIHKNFKPLTRKSVENAVNLLENHLKKFL
ncbi:MAG: restriction endonuclease [Chitinivibrionia bacterium]|nr:restriction endonuclease [Chitinivibrionia bacterium]